MALTDVLGFFNYPPIRFTAQPVTVNGFFMDTASEHFHTIGYVVLEEGIDGGSKTISSSGGKVHWRVYPATTTFANAGTTIRIGVQDMSTVSAQGDGTFDVSADLVGGTDTIVTDTGYATAMTSGTKTIAHGDFIAIAIEMISRGGSDSVPMLTWNNVLGDSTPWPGTTFNGGSPVMMIEFDDGTFGWVHNTAMLSGFGTVVFNVDTAGFDEYGNLFTVPVNLVCSGVDFYLSSNFSADIEVVLYSDPLGTPTVIEAITIDASHFLSAGILTALFTDKHILRAGQPYAVTIRPTTTNNSTLTYVDVKETSHWLSLGGGKENVYAIKRLNNTGAFVDFNGGTSKTRRIGVNLLASHVDKGSGSASYNLGI